MVLQIDLVVMLVEGYRMVFEFPTISGGINSVNGYWCWIFVLEYNTSLLQMRWNARE